MKNEGKMAVAAMIGGALGMYLVVVMAYWQLCWIGAIAGGLAGAMLYAPKSMLILIWKLTKGLFNLTKKLVRKTASGIAYLFTLEGTVPVILAIIAVIGWIFVIHIWIIPKNWIEPIVVAAVGSLIFSVMLLALCIFIESFNQHVADIIGYCVITTWHIIGWIGVILFNPWLAVYTVPTATVVATITIAIVVPTLIVIGIILVIAFFAALIGAIISTIVLIYFAIQDACDWTIDLIVKIIKAIWSDNWLFSFFFLAVGATSGHLLIVDNYWGDWYRWCLGGLTGFTFAQIILFIRVVFCHKRN